MPRRYARARTIGCFAAIVCVAGCSLLTSYDGFTGGSSSAVDAGQPAPVGSCVNEIPSPPASAVTNSTTTTYLAVTSSIRLNADNSGCNEGLNIDHLVTCPGKPACVTPDEGGIACDIGGEAGIDNNAQELLGTLDVQDSVNDGLQSGSVGLIVGLDHYGGEPNVTGVHVSLYNRVSQADGGGVYVDPDSYPATGVAIPVYSTTGGYVTDGVLTATLPTFAMNLRAQSPIPGSKVLFLRATIDDVVLVGRPHIEADGLHLDHGQLAGRISTSSFITAISEAIPCSELAIGVKSSSVCHSLDVPSDPSQDGTGVVCNALSIGFGFDLVPATLAGIGAAPVIQYCDASAVMNPCH